MSMLNVLWAAPAAVGFAMLFNVRKRALPIIAALAVLAKLIVELTEQQGLSAIAADFIAAFVVGSIAYAIAPRLGEASPVYAFAPVIPLVPGAVIANAFIDGFTTWVSAPSEAASVYSEEFITTLSTGLSAAGMVVALCLGAISPMLLLPSSRTAED